LGIKAFLMNELEFVGIGEEVIKMWRHVAVLEN
jgi:hypothetical protein